jgi:hypothetical protein
MSRKIRVLIIVATVLVLAACAPTQQTDQGVTVESKIDSNLYHMTLEINSDVGGYSETQGSISGSTVNGFGYVSGAIWTDGKGLVRGTILSLSPSASFAKVGDEVIVKTTDFKVAALMPGDKVFLICTTDYEPICSLNEDGYGAAECIDIWEFDYCRMTDFQSPE